MTALITEMVTGVTAGRNETYVWEQDVGKIIKWDNRLASIVFRGNVWRKSDSSDCTRDELLTEKLGEVLWYLYKENSGQEVFAGGVYKHVEKDWMAAEVGGWVVSDTAEFILEGCVIINEDKVAKITLPDRYWAELQHCMEVSCADKAVIICIAAEAGILGSLVQQAEAGKSVEEVADLITHNSGVRVEIIEVERNERFIRELMLSEERWLLQGRND